MLIDALADGLVLLIGAGVTYALRLWLAPILGWEDRMRTTVPKYHGRAPAGGTICGSKAGTSGVFIAPVATGITCDRCLAMMKDLATITRRANRLRKAGVLLGAALFLKALSASPLQAQSGSHGEGHAEHHDWYRGLTQPGTGMSCCNGSADGNEGDCRPTRAYLQDDGTWRAMVDGHWVDVPPHVVLKGLAPDANSHICASKSGTIYCFIGGAPKS